MCVHMTVAHLEKIYYSAFKDDPLCIHRGSIVNLTIPSDTDSFYPFCSNCSSKERMHIRVSNVLLVCTFTILSICYTHESTWPGLICQIRFNSSKLSYDLQKQLARAQA